MQIFSHSPKKVIYSFITLFLLSFTSLFAQTNIGGIINDYEGVVSINNPGCAPCDFASSCINEIRVTDASAFSIGDRALIIQMKGATIDQTNSVSGGNITNIGNAGNYEFFEIGNKIGNSIFPTTPLKRTYDTPGLVQLVRVPVYTGDVNITSTIQAVPWNSTTNEGGVIALFVEGTLTLNANIDAGEIGYKGVTVNTNGSPDNCSINPNTQFMGPATNSDKSPKGNGIVVENTSYNGGRAPGANGGGGGVSGDSGGGGGSNFGTGGRGGNRWCDTGSPALAGGLGGVSLSTYLNQKRVFMGGAGGAGFITNLNPAIATNGGGIVVIRASHIVGNNYTIFAQGANSTAPGTGIDGGGGGGAGGTVAFNVKTYSGTININISGGDGQDLGTNVLHGPGGGGGGGAFLNNLITPPANIIINAAGGIAGVHSGSQSTNTNFATNGNPGGVINYYSLVENDNNDAGPGGDDFSDFCDLDSDNDGILDSVENGNTGFDPSQDADGDGIPNYLDQSDITAGFPAFVDTNGDGVNDVYDFDGDGIADFRDLDSDNDGITDVLESGGTDANLDGRADGAVGTTPTTQGVPSSAGTGTVPLNSDSNGLPNHLDLDSDNDGCTDVGEAGFTDQNADGKLGALPTITNVNGIVTGTTVVNGYTGTNANVTTVNTTPSATITYAGTPFCSNNVAAQSVTRTGTAGGTYSALPAGLTINSSTGAITPSTSTPGAYTVSYTFPPNTGGCFGFTTTASVTITTAPTATISYAGSPYCSTVVGAQSVTRTGTAGGTYSALPAGLTINASTGAVTPSSSTAGTYTVTYTIAASGGCAAFSTTASVTITTAPTATISYAGSPYCTSLVGAQSVTRTGTAGGTYSALPAGLTINASTGAVTPSSSTAGSYTVTYTIAASGGCAAFSTTASVTITTAPTATISYAGSPYCSTVVGAQSVTRTGTAGGTYSALPAGLTINASTGAVTPSSSTAGTYTVTYTIAASGGCAAFTTTASVTITTAPTATISYAGSPYCTSLVGAQSVTRTGTAGGTYSALPAGLTINASTGAVTPSSSTAGSYTVTYTIAASGGCAAFSTTASVTITTAPTATISYAGSPYCSTVVGAQSVTRTGTAGGTYSALPAGLTINASTGAVTPSSSTAGTYTVTYTIAASGGCAAFSTTASVTITAAPTATISYAGSPYCTSLVGAQSVTRTGTAGGTYSALPAGLTINASTGAVTPSSSTPGTYTVTYSIPASGGCPVFTTTASVTVTSKSSCDD